MPGIMQYLYGNNTDTDDFEQQTENDLERELRRDRERRLEELREVIMRDIDAEDDQPPEFQPHRANVGNPQNVRGHTTTEFQTEPQAAVPEPETMQAEPEPEPEVDTRQWTTINYEYFKYGSKSKYTKDKEKLDI